MQTLNDRLEIYCAANNKIAPYGGHLNVISFAVIEAVKAAGKYEKVNKKDVPMEVNNYPNELIPIIDGVIEKFFENKNQFLRGVVRPQKTKFFNYDVEDYKSAAFEEALSKLGFDIMQNFNQKGKCQYRLSIGDPAKLVKLGKLFQKIRSFQIRESKRNKQ